MRCSFECVGGAARLDVTSDFRGGVVENAPSRAGLQPLE